MSSTRASAQGGMVPGPQTNAFSRSTFTSVSRGFVRKLTLVYKGHPKGGCDNSGVASHVRGLTLDVLGGECACDAAPL